jgi:hypothetical protein
MHKRPVHKQVDHRQLMIGHGIAIAIAVCALYVIVVESVGWAVYGTLLFGIALALEIVVGVHCHEDPKKASGASPWRVTNVGPIEHRRRL